MTARRLYHGISVSYRMRWELMVCWRGFLPSFDITRQRGFMRVCVGPARVFVVWPSRSGAV